MKKQINDLSQLNIKDQSKTGLINNWLAIGLIIIATVFVYSNSLKAPFIFDDIPKIVENPDIKNLNNLNTRLVYPYSKEYHDYSRNDPSRPLVYLTFALNYHFGKLNTFGYHLFNLFLHIMNAILIFFLMKKIVSYLSSVQSPIFPLFVALLFAVHPINTSAVTYIFSRSVLLSTFFYTLSILLFIQTFERKNKIIYICSLVSFILALFSRQDVVTLPAIILLFDYIFLSDFKMLKVREKKYYHIPYWLILTGYILFRYSYFGGLGDVEGKNLPSAYLYFINQLYVIWKYLVLLIIPKDICIDRGSFFLVNSFFEPKTLLSIAGIMGLVVICWKAYKERTSISKVSLFSLIWYFIALSPTSSVFPTTSIMVDNRLYLSGIGFYVILVFLIISLSKKYNKNWVLTVLLIYVFALGIGTYKRNQLFQQPILLWEDVISKYPNNARVHSNLGLLLYNSKKFEKAEKEYTEAVKINSNNAEVHYNLGLLLNDFNKKAEAEKEFRKAITINPNYAKAHNNLGNLLHNAKRYDEAEREFKEAIRINPNIAEVHNNLGGLLYNVKRYMAAAKEFEEVVRINPNYANAHYNLGALYYELKQYDKALQEYKSAMMLSPNDRDIQNKINLLNKIIINKVDER